MIKKFTSLILFLSVVLFAYSQDSIFVRGTKYRVDTLIQKHDVGLGAMHSKYSLPDLPLVVSVLEIDASNPWVKVMSCLSNDTLRDLERPSRMATRHSSAGHQVFAAINGDFYNTSGVDKGLTVNGQLLNGQVAKVPNGSLPLMAFDGDKQPFLDAMTFGGSVTAHGSTFTIHSVNSSRGTNQLILYNQYNGKNTGTNIYGTEVEVELTSGEWGVNQALTAVVRKKESGVGSMPLTSGRAILSGHGLAQAFLNGLQVNDEVEISTQITLAGSPSDLPHLKEMVGGDRIILSDGEIQDNDWAVLHPRTGIGYSQDKNRIILTVVDGRSTVAAGVTTKQLADIMKQSGAWWAANLDGGGSSVMVVRDKISNTPSDGAERSVANAYLFVSTAPEAPGVKMVLDRHSLSVPYGNKAKINASTFNQYGDVVEYLNAANVSYRQVGEIGSIDADGLFTATGTAYSGLIIGEWNDQADTVHVTVRPVEELTLEHDHLTIDHLNDYTFLVYGKGEDGTPYLMNNDLLQFESSDESVGTVSAGGVFSGVSDGNVQVRVFAGDGAAADTCYVTVEIGRGHVLLDDFSDPSSWLVSKSWIDEVSLSRQLFPGTNEEVLKVDYTMTFANRTASITLEKMIDVYGMPDSLMLQATGNGYSSSFLLMLDHSMGASVVPSFTSEEMMDHQAAIRVADIPQEDYPVSFKSVRLTIERDAAYVVGSTYSGSFYLKGLKAVYPEKDPVSNVVKPAVEQAEVEVFPNPATSWVSVRWSGEGNAEMVFSLFRLDGTPMGVWNMGTLNRGEAFRISVDNLPSGTYLYRVSGSKKSAFGKLIINL